MGADAASSAAAAELERSLRIQYGLDQPMIVQYAKWAWKLLHFDLGLSLEFRQPVRQVIGERLLMTVILAGSTAIMAWALSIPIGIYSAMRQHSVEDYTVTFIGFLGLAVPDFLLAPGPPVDILHRVRPRASGDSSPRTIWTSPGPSDVSWTCSHTSG